MKTVGNAEFGLKEFVCDLAERSWALKAELGNAELGLKEFVCDLTERTELGFEGRVRNAVLGLKEFVRVT